MKLLLLPLALISCAPSAAQIEVCRVEVRAKFHADAEKCETGACIDTLSEREAAELRECRR